MTPTAAVASGGGGWHLYYRHPGGTVPSRPLPGYIGIDIKADGGYVVAPPSIHPSTGRPYRWVRPGPVEEMPPPLVDVCRAATAAPFAPTGARGEASRQARVDTSRPPADPTVHPSGARGISSPAALLAAHLAAIARAPEGKRRVTLYGAARGVARMVAAAAITTEHAWAVLSDAGQVAGQSARDTRAAIAGGFRDEGVSPG